MLQVLLQCLTDDDRYIIGRVQFPRRVSIATIGVEFPVAARDAIDALWLYRLVIVSEYDHRE